MSNKTLKCQLLVCNCENSMKIDEKSLQANLGIEQSPKIHSNLCRSQLADFEREIAKNEGKNLLVACTQEAPLFQELSGDCDVSFVNIREAAGWGKSGGKASAKMAALIAEAAFEPVPTGLLPVTSNGACIVYGAGQQALDVASKLARNLTVSLILTNTNDVIAPATTEFPIYSGAITQISGSMGKFLVSVNQYAAATPSSKDQLVFQDSVSNVELNSDLIFDLSGGEKLIGKSHDRDGYVHVSPQNQVQIAEAIFDISDLVGEFEKPIYVSYDAGICAHSRSNQVGCSNCIDNCPTSAITSMGEGIEVNNNICDGCGHCSSSCPTGAIAYAFPNREDLVKRCQIMISTYLSAGGKNPVLLVHEETHGRQLIAAIARFGDGLAENVLPMSVQSIAHLGHDIFAAFFTSGVQSIVVLAPVKSRDVLDSLKFQIELSNNFMTGLNFDDVARVSLLIEDDPDIVSNELQSIGKVEMPVPKNMVSSKNKRENARLALGNLNDMSGDSISVLELPSNSPYGLIAIDAEKCTLCLACVSSCPAGALGDNEDKPLVSFTENSCVQCGLCRTICPENAISLEPRYNFEKSALSPVVLHEDTPLECSSCGKPFGSKAAIDKVIGILAGKNPMFQTSEQMALLKMCEACRIESMAAAGGDPMTMGRVPRVMTADDVFDEDEEPTRH